MSTANVIPLTRAEILDRASTMVGRGKYKLGKGGRDPQAPTPFDAHGYADCSAYVCWAVGLDRYQDGWGWLDTSGLIRAARDERFVHLDLVEKPEMGDIIVYGDWITSERKVRQGHCGIVIGEIPRWGRWDELLIDDCSPSNERRFGSAVSCDTATIFGARDTYFLRRIL